MDYLKRLGLGIVAVCLLAGTCLCLPAYAATVTRGPYLQMGTPSSIVIRWRTDVPSTSQVSCGTQIGNLSVCAATTQETTEHEIELTGLLPDTTYFYSIGTSAEVLAGGDSTHFFITSPKEGTAKPTRIWVLGDSGSANKKARNVRDAYLAFTGTRHTDLWLMLGDNAYDDGTDSEYQDAVFEMYPTVLRKSVLWPTLGNHDASSADSSTQTGPYYEIFTLPKNGEAGGLSSGTEAYYSFNYGNIHFVVLDSHDTDRSPRGAMMMWLDADLGDTTQDWIVAFWHHPPYSKGSHNSDKERTLIEMRENALPILEKHGVDLVLSGHSHSYERSFLLDGHYGFSDTLAEGMIKNGGNGREDGDGAYQKPNMGSHEGTVYAVAGSSGKKGGGPLNHPAMFISLKTMGSMVLDFSGNRLDAVFLNYAGEERDRFTMIKGQQSNQDREQKELQSIDDSINDSY